MFNVSQGMPTKKLALALATAGLALAGCGGGSSTTTSTSTVAPASTDSTATTQGAATGTSTSGSSNTSTAPSSSGSTSTATSSGSSTTGTTSTTSTTGSSGSTGTTSTSTSTGSTSTVTYSRVVDWTRTEVPTNWNFAAQYPSTSACGAGEGKTFEVGPGKQYANPRDVNWLGLMPCDVVKIYYRSTPYNDIIYLASRGERNKWITVEGVPGPNGERPVFDGNNAVMPVGTGANQWADSSAMIIVQAPDLSVTPGRASDYHPGYLHITGFKFQDAKQTYNVTPLNGVTRKWGEFSSGIQITGAEHIAVTYSEFTNNGNGLFVNSTNGAMLQTRDLLVAHNYFHGNGTVGAASEHNAYTEAIGTTYEYNYFDSPVAGTGGLNIKERSPGIVFRYNYVRNGSILLGLMDPDSNKDYEKLAVDAWGEDLNSTAFVYSNIFVADAPTAYDNNAPSIIEHGAGGTVSDWNPQIRHGALYFYNNRVVSKFDARTIWILDSSNQGVPVNDSVNLFVIANTRLPTTVDARMNLFYGSSATSGATARPFALFGLQGTANWSANWITAYQNAAVLVSDNAFNVGVAFNGTGLGGLTASTASPSFISPSTGNYLTTSSSPYASLSAAYPTAVTKRGLAPAAGALPPVVPFGQ